MKEITKASASVGLLLATAVLNEEKPKADEHFVISIRRTWWAGWDDHRSGILQRRKPKASLSEKAKQFLPVNVLKINALLGKFHSRLKRKMTPFISPEYSCDDFASLRRQCLRHLYQRLGVQFSCAQIEWVAWWEPWRDEVTWRKENHGAVLAPLLMDASQGQAGDASWSITYQKCRTTKNTAKSQKMDEKSITLDHSRIGHRKDIRDSKDFLPLLAFPPFFFIAD